MNAIANDSGNFGFTTLYFQKRFPEPKNKPLKPKGDITTEEGEGAATSEGVQESQAQVSETMNFQALLQQTMDKQENKHSTDKQNNRGQGRSMQGHSKIGLDSDGTGMTEDAAMASNDLLLFKTLRVGI